MTYERSPRSLSSYMYGNVNKKEHFCNVKFRMIHLLHPLIHIFNPVNRFLFYIFIPFHSPYFYLSKSINVTYIERSVQSVIISFAIDISPSLPHLEDKHILKPPPIHQSSQQVTRFYPCLLKLHQYVDIGPVSSTNSSISSQIIVPSTERMSSLKVLPTPLHSPCVDDAPGGEQRRGGWWWGGVSVQVLQLHSYIIPFCASSAER